MEMTINREILIAFLDGCVDHAKQTNNHDAFFSQAFGAVSLYCAIAYANGNEEEECAVADLWNNDYRDRFMALM